MPLAGLFIQNRTRNLEVSYNDAGGRAKRGKVVSLPSKGSSLPDRKAASKLEVTER